MLPSDIPQLAAYPNVHAFVRDQVNMQFGDVRNILLHPIGCNLAAAAVLCNIISGISVVFYTRNRIHNNGTGRRFREVMTSFFPWQEGEPVADKVQAFYEYTRNPMAHALGVLDPGVPIITAQRPDPLTDAQLHALESAEARPADLPLALVRTAPSAWDLNVHSFYRDVFHLLWNLTRDNGQMQSAEQGLSAGGIRMNRCLCPHCGRGL